MTLNSNSLRILIFSLLSLMCMIIIFMFSSENGPQSADTSGNVTEFVAETVIEDYDILPQAEKDSVLSKIDHIVRKTAHFSVYTALGFCISCAFGRRNVFSLYSAVSIAICFLYACSDELHQYFVPERSCQFTDVLIDSSGGAVGILISLLALNIVQMIIKKGNRKP